MKYVLVTTTYSLQKGMVIKLYLKDDNLFIVNTTTLLADAQVFDTFEHAEEFMDFKLIDGYRIDTVDEKVLFKAKLERT